MAFAMAHLAQDTGLRDQLRSQPERIGDAVWELLRRFPLVSSSREVRKAIDVNGVTLAPGEMVMAPTAAAALDPTFGEEMTDVDIDRRNRLHSVFGRGTHTCPGAYIARTELIVMIREWCTRIPDFHLPSAERIEHVNGIVGAVKPFELEWEV
jgi:cytochrome P450